MPFNGDLSATDRLAVLLLIIIHGTRPNSAYGENRFFWSKNAYKTYNNKVACCINVTH